MVRTLGGAGVGQPTCKYRGRFLRKLRQFSRISKYVAHNLDFLTSFLVSILLYIVLRAGRAQFGFLAGFSSVNLLYVVPGAGCAHYGNFWRIFLMTVLFYVVLGAGRVQFGIFFIDQFVLPVLPRWFP